MTWRPDHTLRVRRRQQSPSLADQKPIAEENWRDWNQARDPRRADRARRDDHLALLPLAPDQTNRRENDERGERVDDPVKLIEHEQTGADQQSARDQRTEYTPQQHASLLRLRNAQFGKDQHEDEDVVYRKRFLEQVRGEIGEPGVSTVEGGDAESKQKRKRNPARASQGSGTHAWLSLVPR